MTATEDDTSPNFGFLAKRYPELERIAACSERYCSDDPIVSLVTLRQFGEGLAQLVAARSGLYNNPNESQRDLLQRLRVDGRYPSMGRMSSSPKYAFVLVLALAVIYAYAPLS